MPLLKGTREHVDKRRGQLRLKRVVRDMRVVEGYDMEVSSSQKEKHRSSKFEEVRLKKRGCVGVCMLAVERSCLVRSHSK